MPLPPSTIALDQLPIGMVLVAPDGSVAAINPAACRIFGQLPDAVIGSSARALVQLDLDRWQALLDGAVQHGRAIHEHQLAPEAGLHDLHGLPLDRSIQLIAAASLSDGQPVLQLVVIDAPIRSGHAAPGAATRRSATLPPDPASAQRLDSLALVAGGIAHDFNNLLVGVLAEASAAREDRTLGSGPREALRRIEAAAGRMSQLTKQLLAYAGRGRVVNVRLDPDVMVGDLRDQLAKIVRRPASLEIVPGAGTVVVEADPNLLRQVLINLVSNASDAAGNHVQVATRILSRENVPWWQLEVSDDGVGIDAATLARIFDPFFSTKQDRHGLGLSAVHGIVRRLGGDIEVDSKPGQGARFRVRLPIVPGAEPPPRTVQEPSVPGPRLAGLRVLIADDEPSVRATVRRLLERRGATVVVAADGSEAEARLRDERFDLVVLDVTMPGRSGYDVLAFARANQPTLPVILMSGYTARVRGEGGEEEPDAFIEKPFTAKVLDGAIDDVLHGRTIALAR